MCIVSDAIRFIFKSIDSKSIGEARPFNPNSEFKFNWEFLPMLRYGMGKSAIFNMNLMENI